MADQTRLRAVSHKTRAFVVSDISNEPDDAESLVRFLLYGNELDIQGLVACTSCWIKHHVHPEDMHSIVDGYAQVVDNLNQHVHPSNPYPSADYLRGIIKAGPALYGREALEPDVPLSEGAALLLERVDASDDPLWVLCWGGTNVLAQALQFARRTRSATDLAKVTSKLRVYAISDQDDTGMWIRVNFPDILYICSVHGWKEYGMAAWIGIAGDLLAPIDEGGPDKTKVTREWLKENVQIGPLGAKYPDYSFIMEGDTPTFLYLIQNGLGSSEHPSWGSWGGRYVLGDIGGASMHYLDARDEVIGKDGRRHLSNQATIWRWRDAYQNDFAARMRWTLSADRAGVNHAPVVIVNGSSSGPEPLFIDAEAGAEITLDASETYDPDGDELTFRWFQYKEPTAAQSQVHWPRVPDVTFESIDDKKPEGSVVRVKLPPPEVSAVELVTGKALEKGQALHFILEVKDNGSPGMITYKRVVVQITNVDGRGASGKTFDTVTEALGFSTG